MRAPAEILFTVVLALGIPAAVHAQADGSLASTVGELVRIEAQRAVIEARKTVAGSSVQPAAPTAFKKASESTSSDVIELLGIYKREREFSADVALNGVVRYVKSGDQLGSYAIKSIGERCVYLTDSNRAEYLRCVSMTSDK